VLILSLFLLAIITWRAYREYARGQPRRTFGHKAV
jgi:hypothetical protein